jgi:hypothetical protein
MVGVQFGSSAYTNVIVPAAIVTKTGPGWLCQPVWPPGVSVIVWVTTSMSSLILSFRKSV